MILIVPLAYVGYATGAALLTTALAISNSGCVKKDIVTEDPPRDAGGNGKSEEVAGAGEGEGEGLEGEPVNPPLNGEGEGEPPVGEGEGEKPVGAEGEGEGELPPPPPPRADVNINPTSKLALFAGQYGAPQGILASLELQGRRLGNWLNRESIANTDTILRSDPKGERLFVIERTPTAVVRVYGENWVAERIIPVGEGTNPQDLVYVPWKHSAYISRLEANNAAQGEDQDIVIYNIEGGFLEGGIDLTRGAAWDGDPLPRAAQMTLVGAELYVLLQDSGPGFELNTNGKVAVIDTNTNRVTDVIPLEGWNPADITYSEILGRVFVTNTGTYNPDFTVDTTTDLGGIEAIDPIEKRSLGIVIPDEDLGGGVSELRLASGKLGYVIINFKGIAAFNPQFALDDNPETDPVLDTAVYTSPGFFMPDFTLDASGRLIIAETGGETAGVLLLDPSEEDPSFNLLSTDLPPASLTFVSEPF